MRVFLFLFVKLIDPALFGSAQTENKGKTFFLGRGLADFKTATNICNLLGSGLAIPRSLELVQELIDLVGNVSGRYNFCYTTALIRRATLFT